MHEYSFSNKEPLLEALTSPDFDSPNNFDLYRNELNGINNQENWLDFLEILPWDRIGKIAELLNYLSSEKFIEIPVTSPTEGPTKYDLYCSERISNFSNELQLLLNSVDTKLQTKSLLLTSRKVLGLPRNKIEMSTITNLLTQVKNSESLPENDLILIQYPGTFLPFPHKAHIELAQNAFFDLSPLNMFETRVVVSTFEKNSYRNDSVPKFKDRVGNLSKGFALQEFATVIGISGDSDKQFEQMKIVSNLSSDRVINYLCGSDTIVKKVQLALDGDSRAKKFFNSSTNFIVSIRPNEDMNKLESVIKMAEAIEGSTITVLPSNRTIDLSGTEIRQKIDDGISSPDMYPNEFIGELYSN